MRILLDTDIGSDIDDAWCLTYLLAQPECELVGISTVSGDVVARAELASAICTHVGRTVPIRAGRDAPRSGPQLQPKAPQEEALARWEHETGFVRDTAVDFMADAVLSDPGNVWLLAIGPLTNVAELFSAHPEVPGRLRGLMMMAGAFRSQGGRGKWNEWNVRCDPESAALVYGTEVPVHRSVGLNVTTRARLSADEVRAACTHERWQPALDMAETWFRKRPVTLFHDPLAAAALFDDSFLEWNRGVVSVGLDGEDRGSTTLELTHEGPHEAASFVKAERFFDHFFSVAG